MERRMRWCLRDTPTETGEDGLQSGLQACVGSDLDVEDILDPIEEELKQDDRNQADGCKDEPVSYGCKDSSLLGFLLGFCIMAI